ncbi:hypothetical protein [Psychrosphaera algicola]|uniref:Uncharacterized protein n=1 Tax=Psychrosphaera algicola TaxID=3023714 RepID=A0ABT5FDA3_9GAMM|nr:hypothetical protein [Psychrosphaera sp. G1-22]MDC2889114.1 hypothetical protein [Psychrosphaera sp. G1-22]
MFKLSDFISGGVFGIASLGALLSFIVPPIMLVVAATIYSLSLGGWGYLYFVVFIGLNYLTFRHKSVALLGHMILILLLVVLGSGLSYLYTALFFIYLLPYIFVFNEAAKHNKSSKSGR